MTPTGSSRRDDEIAEANKDLVRRFNSEVYGEGNLDLINELVAEGHIMHDPMSPEEMRGPEAVREQVEMLRSAFPDLAMAEEDTFAEGDRVAHRWTAQGTHEGPLEDIEPTGATVEVTGIDTYRIENGKIVESWLSYDALNLMQQLGAVPEKPN